MNTMTQRIDSLEDTMQEGFAKMGKRFDRLLGTGKFDDLGASVELTAKHILEKEHGQKFRRGYTLEQVEDVRVSYF